MWGANYDQDLTWPSFFSDQTTSWLQHASERLHSAGKVMFTHCDGENDALTELLLESGADVAESIYPAPMTKLSLAELRGRRGTTMAICGGILSVALLPDVFDDDAYRQFMDATFAELKPDPGSRRHGASRGGPRQGRGYRSAYRGLRPGRLASRRPCGRRSTA